MYICKVNSNKYAFKIGRINNILIWSRNYLENIFWILTAHLLLSKSVAFSQFDQSQVIKFNQLNWVDYINIIRAVYITHCLYLYLLSVLYTEGIIDLIFISIDRSICIRLYYTRELSSWQHSDSWQFASVARAYRYEIAI